MFNLTIKNGETKITVEAPKAPSTQDLVALIEVLFDNRSTEEVVVAPPPPPPVPVQVRAQVQEPRIAVSLRRWIMDNVEEVLEYDVNDVYSTLQHELVEEGAVIRACAYSSVKTYYTSAKNGTF